MGQHKEKREIEWISRGLNRGARWANQRKKEKMNGLVGANNMGWGGPTLVKERKQMD